MTWSAREAEALATIGLLAAQSDGERDLLERETLTETFAAFGAAGTASVHARVALGTAVLGEEARALGSPELRRLAWELALGVCHADGMVVEREKTFLEELRHALGLPAEDVSSSSAMAAALAPPAAVAAVATAAVAATPVAAAAVLDASADAALEKTIREAAILAGALELLPQNLATLAIVPLQAKLVADVGAAYGHRVDFGHARELLAAVGLGLSGQAVEGFARRFLGRLAGRFGGGVIGGLVDAATGAAATFAATWAIGQVARSWYASGRALDPEDVQARFAAGLEEGQRAFATLEGTVSERARMITLPDLTRMLQR
jgi:uncharacterized protein (DUF697 family)/tellurite resistance protein